MNQAVNLSEIPTKSAFRIICKILFGDEIFDKIGLLDYTCPYTGEKRKMTLEEFYPKIAKNVFDAYINPKGKIFSFLANRNLIDPYKTNIKNTYELYQVVGKFCENYSDSESIYQKMKSSGEFTDDECLNDTLILLFAGFDTTSHTVSSILCMLKRNPDKFEKLMEEMKIAKLNEIDRSEKRDYANIINGCDYLMHVVREGLRMEPPTFDSLVYEVVEDTQL